MHCLQKLESTLVRAKNKVQAICIFLACLQWEVLALLLTLSSSLCCACRLSRGGTAAVGAAAAAAGAPPEQAAQVAEAMAQNPGARGMDLAARMMEKMGWKSGLGLGRNKQACCFLFVSYILCVSVFWAGTNPTTIPHSAFADVHISGTSGLGLGRNEHVRHNAGTARGMEYGRHHLGITWSHLLLPGLVGLGILLCQSQVARSGLGLGGSATLVLSLLCTFEHAASGLACTNADSVQFYRSQDTASEQVECDQLVCCSNTVTHVFKVKTDLST